MGRLMDDHVHAVIWFVAKQWQGCYIYIRMNNWYFSMFCHTLNTVLTMFQDTSTNSKPWLLSTNHKLTMPGGGGAKFNEYIMLRN